MAPTTADLLKDVELTANAPQNGEKDESLKDQEAAIIKLGELYRDQKWVSLLNTSVGSVNLCTEMQKDLQKLSRILGLSCHLRQKLRPLSSVSTFSVISVLPLIASYSPYPPRFLRPHPGQPTNSNKCPHGQYWLGKEGEASILEA